MPDLISDLSISEYLEVLASKSATPGGGSASALIAAQGTALLSMVCEFSRPSDESLLDINKRCSVTQTNLLRLVQKDVDAFNEVMNWFADKQISRILYNDAPEQCCPPSILGDDIRLCPGAGSEIV